MPGEFQYHLDGINHPDALHRPEIHRRSIADLLSGKDRAFDNVVDVRPVADLRAVAPHLEWIPTGERARDHGDDGVIFNTPRSVHREIAARRGAQPVFFVIRLQREFAHQLCPAVHVVRVLRAFRQILGQVKLLLDVRLQKIRIDAARGSENHFFHFGLERFRENQAIEKKI